MLKLRLVAPLLLVSTAAGQTALPASIDDSTFGPLKSGVTYTANRTVQVPIGKTLTIQPDVVIKFSGLVSFQVLGSLSAVGTKAKPIVFTSIQDDTVGKKTGSKSPAAGDWKALTFIRSGTSLLQWAEVRFAEVNSMGFVSTSSVVVRDVLVRDGAGFGMFVDALSLPTIERCDVRNCGSRAYRGVNVTGLPKFRNNRASGNGGGDSVQAFGGSVATAVRTPVRIKLENTLNGEIDLFGLSVLGTNASVTFDPGIIIKITATPSISNGGRILAKGTAAQPVIFTSTQDDTVGNDTTGNGPTTGSPGDWDFFHFGSSGSRFDHTIFRFGGGLNVRKASFFLVNTRNDFYNCTFSDHAAPSVFNFNGGTNNPALVPQIHDCDFQNNTGRPFPAINWLSVTGLRDNTAANNTGGNHLEVNAQRIPVTTAIYRHNTLNGTGVIACRGIFVDGGREFLLGPGLILKPKPGDSFVTSTGSLVFDGRGDAPITITSWKDDSIGGDTNMDGSATKPAPGDWYGVKYTGIRDSAKGYMSHVHLRYGGGDSRSPQTVFSQSGAVRITGVRVDFSQRTGFQLNALQGRAANLIAYKCGGTGIVAAAGGFFVQHATATENTGVGILGGSKYTGTCFNSISWNNGSRLEKDNFVTIKTENCNGVRTRSNIFADPMFVDVAKGDLHIKSGSLCVGRGNLKQAALWGEDFDGNSRILDHTENGLALPDIGAYEVFRFRMKITGEMRIGKPLRLEVFGPGPRTGFQWLFAGPAVGGEFVPPFGVLLVGTLATTAVLFSQPTGSSFSITIPKDTSLLGVRGGLQYAVIAAPSRPAGNVTNPLLGTITN